MLIRQRNDLTVLAAALIIGLIIMTMCLMLKTPDARAGSALYEISLSPTATTSGEYVALSNEPFNISVYYTSTGIDPGVTIQRCFRTAPTTWRDVKEYTDDVETTEDHAPNSPMYWYRAKYTGTTGAANVRIDQ